MTKFIAMVGYNTSGCVCSISVVFFATEKCLWSHVVRFAIEPIPMLCWVLTISISSSFSDLFPFCAPCRSSVSQIVKIPTCQRSEVDHFKRNGIRVSMRNHLTFSILSAPSAFRSVFSLYSSNLFSEMRKHG